MTTFCASGAMAWATSRSIVVSPRGSAGWPPTRVGVNFGSLYRVAKLSRSAWSKPSNAKITMVWPLPVKPAEASLLTL